MHIKIYIPPSQEYDPEATVPLASIPIWDRGPKICRESHVSRDSRVTHGIFSSFVRDCEGQQKFSCDRA